MMNRKTSCTALSVFTLSLLGATDRTFAQGVFEGSGEDESEVSNCVGDGCGIEFPTESAQENPQEMNTYGEDTTAVQIASDSLQQDSVPTAHLDDEEDARDYFVESASEFRARKQGFSRRIQFGVRVGGGVNVPFRDNDSWNLGFGFGGGIAAKLPLTNSGLGVAAGLEFGYRQFNYEGETDFSKDEATVSQMLFEIPVTLQYAFDDEGFFFGAGGNIQLKMAGESDFTQKINTDQVHSKDKRHNTLPTTGVEAGVTAILGFTFNSWSQVDVRGTFNFTNLLDQDVIAESSLMGTALHMLYVNIGFTILL